MIVRKTYRYPMRHSLGPRMGFGALVVLTACATTPPFVSRKQPDGSYELTCKLPLSQCLDNVDQVCGGAPYDVVSGHDHRRAIDIRVGTYQNEVRSSDAVVRCVHAKPLFGGDTTPAEGAAAAAPPPEKPHVCVPGITQASLHLRGAGRQPGRRRRRGRRQQPLMAANSFPQPVSPQMSPWFASQL